MLTWMFEVTKLDRMYYIEIFKGTTKMGEIYISEIQEIRSGMDMRMCGYKERYF